MVLLLGVYSRRGILAALGLVSLSVPQQVSADAVSEGAYLIRAAGCVACHTDLAAGGEYLAGGPALKTPFGTFWAPNITSDPDTGLGAWDRSAFHDAIRKGLAPDGSHYYPVFPYPSYTKMTDRDIDALWAYLQTVPPVIASVPDHDLGFPYSMRFLMAGWKQLSFKEGPVADTPAQSEIWNRGRYLTDALGHCGECHTPRDMLGAVDQSRYLAGNLDGPDGEEVPNITPHETGLADWEEDDVITLLVDGMKPDFDTIQGSMEEVVTHSTSFLSDDDLEAMASYLLSIPALPTASKTDP